MIQCQWQNLKRILTESGIVKFGEETADYIQFCLENPVCLLNIQSRLPFAFCLRISFQSLFQFIGNADIIHDQTAWFILENPVDTGNSLHQIVSLHRFIHIHGVATWRIKSGQPHIPDNDQFQFIFGSFKTLFEPLFCLFAVNVFGNLRLVSSGTCHNDFDCSFFRLIGMPRRTQCNDFVVKVHADLTTHTDDHCLTDKSFSPFFIVGHQVGGKFF